MILSMTGYGRGEVMEKNFAASVEVRSVNNRFLEISVRIPRTLSTREQEIKEIARQYFSRGKLSISITIENGDAKNFPLKVNASSAKAHLKLLNNLRRTLKLRETVKLSHMLQFSEIFDLNENPQIEDEQWQYVVAASHKALSDLKKMRREEGSELGKDILARLKSIDETVGSIERISRERIPRERKRLKEKVNQILDKHEIDEQRITMELILLADKLDVTEECVRLRSHLKYFHENIGLDEPSGRKLNFLLQEINREVNTIGSKANDADISQYVVNMKEELEKIREQLQNIE